MKMFKKMSLQEAKRLYNQLRDERDRLIEEKKDIWILNTFINDLLFFTNELTQDY